MELSLGQGLTRAPLLEPRGSRVLAYDAPQPFWGVRIIEDDLSCAADRRRTRRVPGGPTQGIMCAKARSIAGKSPINGLLKKKDGICYSFGAAENQLNTDLGG